MEEKYLQLAAAYENLAAAYRSLVAEAPAAPEKKTETVLAPAPALAPEVTLEELRALLSEKMEAGKRKQVKDLLMKYDSGKLSGVKPEDYVALKAEAEAL